MCPVRALIAERRPWENPKVSLWHLERGGHLRVILVNLAWYKAKWTCTKKERIKFVHQTQTERIIEDSFGTLKDEMRSRLTL